MVKASPISLTLSSFNFSLLLNRPGSTPGVYMLDQSNEMRAIFEAYDPIYKGDETTGIAFSPTGNIMYANFQDCGCEVTYANDCGCLFQFTRDDGLSYDAESKYFVQFKMFEIDVDVIVSKLMIVVVSLEKQHRQV